MDRINIYKSFRFSWLPKRDGYRYDYRNSNGKMLDIHVYQFFWLGWCFEVELAEEQKYGT